MDYIEKKFSFVLPSELNMYYCGKREHTYNHQYGPAVRDHFLLVYISEGEAVLTYKTKPIMLTPGHILFMFPGEKIYYKVKENTPWTILWVGVYGKLVYDYISPLGITRNSPVYKCPRPDETKNIIEKIISAADTHTLNGKIHCISLIHEFFSVLSDSNGDIKPFANRTDYDNCNDMHEITYSSDNIYIREAENFIRFHYDNNITVADLASQVNLEKSYFSRLFKKETGSTPQQRIIELRIKKACMLLKHTSLSISEISGCIGLEDSQYFSRLFKKEMGVSPSGYRKTV